MNMATKRTYTGINVILLYLTDYIDPYWATFVQIKKLGGSVKKGERSTQIVYTEFIIKHRETKKKITYAEFKALSKEERSHYRFNKFFRYHYVFNIAQTEGISIKDLESIEAFNDPILACEDIINGFDDRPEIECRRIAPAYYPTLDKIKMPKISSYETSEFFYGTLFHEMVHSTGHPNRLDRDSLNNFDAFGTEVYSKEELVAEIGSCFLKAKTSIDHKCMNNSIAYINGWISALKNDKTLIIQAASEAQKAFNLIINNKGA